jgi:hypothetical protein
LNIKTALSVKEISLLDSYNLESQKVAIKLLAAVDKRSGIKSAKDTASEVLSQA